MGCALTLTDGEGRTPLVTQNVKTDAAIRVDVGVVDASCEVHLGRLEGVICGEMDGEKEDTTRVRRITLQVLVSSWLLVFAV
jgi:hypothetical protein